MGRIPGYYEWDDDDLTPGRKKEGGLHQNLFDEDGHLKGNARFIPTGEPDSDSAYDTDYVRESIFVPAEERRLTPELQVLADLISEILVDSLAIGFERAKPHLKAWWTESVRPFMGEKRAWLSKTGRKRNTKVANTIGSENIITSGDQTQTDTIATPAPQMSSAEAQARYLAAMAARVFSEEQMRMVQNASIIGTKDIGEIQARIIQLPPNDIRELMVRMATDPTLLGEKTLAELASVLARADHHAQDGFYQLPSDHN